MPLAAAADTGIKRKADAFHVVGGLGLERWGNGNDPPAGVGRTEQQPGEEACLEFVLFRLARQHDHEGQVQLVQDRFFDRLGDLALVGAQVDPAGGRPADRVTLDGFTKAQTEGRKAFRIVHIKGKNEMDTCTYQRYIGKF